MAIDKLNFSGINTGYKDFETPLESVSNRLMKYGANLNDRDAERARQKKADEQIAYQKERDSIADIRFNEKIAKDDAEKNRLISKEYNTANAMQSIYDPEKYKANRLISEQKAIEDSMSNLSPEDQLIARAELAKNYVPEDSGKQWIDTAMSQSNVDSAKLADLRINMDKQRIQEEQFAENKRLQERELDIKDENARLARQDKLDAKKIKPKYEQFYDENGKVATVDVNDPESLDNAAKSGFYSIELIKQLGKGTTSGSKDSGIGNNFFNKKNKVANINYSSLGKDQQKKLDELSSSVFRFSTGEKKEVVNFLDKVDSVSKAANLNKKEAEELVDLATGSVFGSEISLNKDILDARYGKEVFATPEGTITKSDALYSAFNRPETFKIVNIPQEGGRPDKKMFLDLTLPKHKAAYEQYSGIEPKVSESKALQETVAKKTVEKNRSDEQKSNNSLNENGNRLSNFLLTNPAPTVENLKIIEDISSSIKNKEIEERARDLSNSMKTSGVGSMSEKNKEDWKTLYNLIANPASKAYSSYQENVGKPFVRFINENAPGGNR